MVVFQPPLSDRNKTIVREPNQLIAESKFRETDMVTAEISGHSCGIYLGTTCAWQVIKRDREIKQRTCDFDRGDVTFSQMFRWQTVFRDRNGARRCSTRLRGGSLTGASDIVREMPPRGLSFVPDAGGTISWTPLYKWDTEKILRDAVGDAAIYRDCKVDGVLVENMNDVPYVKAGDVLPETTAMMTRICTEIRKALPDNLPCGVQGATRKRSRLRRLPTSSSSGRRVTSSRTSPTRASRTPAPARCCDTGARSTPTTFSSSPT
ncbi:uncharacterized protein LOC117221054 isoform X5 [Megalopta genalis]|uniref:uncharacterized protein LOC117221054 isoform X5 n=1 Tax=Megalopta genalis TaxID=115081 RepID=UPI003FD13349